MTVLQWRSLMAKLLLAVSLILPLVANAGTVEGRVNGISCAIAGEICPVDKLDPHLALETDFVVQQADGTFYLVPNVDRAVKARLVLEEVSVTGDVNDRYKSVTASEIAVKRGGEMKTIWTQKMQDEARQALYRGSN